MGSTTKHGLLWPNDTDPYQQGAYAMRTLAEGIDTALPRMKWGLFSGPGVGGGNDFYVVTHNLGVTPEFVAITHNHAQATAVYGVVYKVISMSSTIMNVEVRRVSNDTLQVNSQRFMWFVLAS